MCAKGRSGRFPPCTGLIEIARPSGFSWSSGSAKFHRIGFIVRAPARLAARLLEIPTNGTYEMAKRLLIAPGAHGRPYLRRFSGNGSVVQALTIMERICLFVVYASVVGLVAAIALIGPPPNERSREFAVALQMQQLNQADAEGKMLSLAGLTRLKSSERPSKAAKQ